MYNFNLYYKDYNLVKNNKILQILVEIINICMGKKKYFRFDQYCSTYTVKFFTTDIWCSPLYKRCPYIFTDISVTFA